MTKIGSGLVILATLLMSGSCAMAQSGKPCAGDVKKLCAGIQPGESRIKSCMKSHLSELSQSCEDRLLTVAITGKVCTGDIAKLCAGVVPGTGGLRACLKSHMADISDPCKDAMAGTASGKKLLGGFL